MLVPDFMHEFELGIWKALFTHLVRILVSHGDGTIQDFNRRYRQVPTFGRSTIRRFSENASGMKKLAARNFEDLLQVHLRSHLKFELLLTAFKSVLYLFLMVCCLPNTITTSSRFFSQLQNGIHWRRCAYIQTLR
jgi:hypothetical protein